MIHRKAQASPLRSLAKRLATSTTPLYLLDEHFRLVFANESLASLLGCTAEQLIGLDCRAWRAPEAENHDVESHPARMALPQADRLAAWLAVPPGQCDQLSMSKWLGPWPAPEHSASPSQAGLGAVRVCVPLLPQGDTSGPSVGEGRVEGVLAWVLPLEPTTPWSRVLATTDALQQQVLQALALARQQPAVFSLPSLLGLSLQVRRSVAQMELAISCRTSTWIVGPPGCQKSKVARGIWAARARANGWSVAQSPCLPIQCELMDREMLSGMLEMLTNRVREEKGHACLLLEHIDRLPEEVHGTLLRFLDTAPACQCLATSSLTPEACTTGRPGMYPIVSRTSTLVCHVPSLAQRPRDLAPIAEAILDQWAKESNGTTKQLAAQTLTLLQAYPWQGNVEELTEALRESAGRAPNRWIEPSHLPIAMRTFPSFVERDDGPPRTIDLDRFLEETERRILKRALELHRGNRSSAARSLNISRARFLRRLEQLGLRSVPSAQDATAEESTRAVPVTSAPAASDPASSAQDETGRAPEANKDNAWAPSKPVPDPNSELTMISDDWAEEHFKEFEKDE